MRVATKTLVLLMILPAAELLADAADGPPMLAHNPFSRPPSEALSLVSQNSGQEAAATGIPELQATMIGSVNKLANVSGQILKRGDEIQGYVLVAIHEQYAVFRRNGEDTTVYVKPLAKDDE